MIIAKEVSTLVLELENDMVELERPIFITSDTTVAAGELANGSIAVQVITFSHESSKFILESIFLNCRSLQ